MEFCMVVDHPCASGSAGKPWGSNQRRKFFAASKNLRGRSFGTELVWTFHIWQQFISMSDYKLQLPLGLTFKLARHLVGHLQAASCLVLRTVLCAGNQYFNTVLVK
jgi:Protein of unknown function (DUF1769)